MNICEATKEALKTGKCIKRLSSSSPYRFRPTNTSDCVLIFPENIERSTGRRWNPTAAELTADDWELVDFPIERTDKNDSRRNY